MVSIVSVMRVLFDLLHKIENSNAQGEYYLPDIVPLALKRWENG